MSKKTVVSVELPCLKCWQKVIKLIAEVEGVTSIALDPAKKTVTVIGEADPVKIIKMVRKHRKTAAISSVGPSKEEKKDDTSKKDGGGICIVPMTPRACHRCDVWYVVGDDRFSYCSIL